MSTLIHPDAIARGMTDDDVKEGDPATCYVDGRVEGPATVTTVFRSKAGVVWRVEVRPEWGEHFIFTYAYTRVRTLKRLRQRTKELALLRQAEHKATADFENAALQDPGITLEALGNLRARCALAMQAQEAAQELSVLDGQYVRGGGSTPSIHFARRHTVKVGVREIENRDGIIRLADGSELLLVNPGKELAKQDLVDVGVNQADVK